MTHEHRGVAWLVLLGDEVPDYRLSVEYGGDALPPPTTLPIPADARRHGPHLITEGRHERLWEVMGRTHTYETKRRHLWRLVRGVGANAQGVRVVGDFNHWDGTSAPMRTWAHRASGSCSCRDRRRTVLQVPDPGRDGVRRLKADPFALRH